MRVTGLQPSSPVRALALLCVPHSRACLTARQAPLRAHSAAAKLAMLSSWHTVMCLSSTGRIRVDSERGGAFHTFKCFKPRAPRIPRCTACRSVRNAALLRVASFRGGLLTTGVGPSRSSRSSRKRQNLPHRPNIALDCSESLGAFCRRWYRPGDRGGCEAHLFRGGGACLMGAAVRGHRGRRAHQQHGDAREPGLGAGAHPRCVSVSTLRRHWQCSSALALGHRHHLFEERRAAAHARVLVQHTVCCKAVSPVHCTGLHLRPSHVSRVTSSDSHYANARRRSELL